MLPAGGPVESLDGHGLRKAPTVGPTEIIADVTIRVCEGEAARAFPLARSGRAKCVIRVRRSMPCAEPRTENVQGPVLLTIAWLGGTKVRKRGIPTMDGVP